MQRLADLIRRSKVIVTQITITLDSHHHVGIERPTQKVMKGDNPYTEHYSALMAEVPDINDASTRLNQKLLESLTLAETLLIAGEAGRAAIHHNTVAGPTAKRLGTSL